MSESRVSNGAKLLVVAQYTIIPHSWPYSMQFPFVCQKHNHLSRNNTANKNTTIWSKHSWD